MTRLILPIPPSLNQAYENQMVRGRRIRVLSREAERFKTEAQLLALSWRNQTGWLLPLPDRKIIVRAWYFWGNMYDNDANNRWKVLFDALEGILYHNDSMVMEHVVNIELDRNNPRLELEFEVGEPWPAKTKLLQKKRKKAAKHA